MSRAAAATSPLPDGSSPADRLLRELLVNFVDEYERGLPTLRKSLPSFSSELPWDQEISWLMLATTAASGVWDAEGWEAIGDRYVDLCYELGALTELPLALTSRAFLFLFAGKLTAAESVIREAEALMTAIGSSLGPYSSLALAAFRGHEAEVSTLESAVQGAVQQGEGWAITATEWAIALLNNGLCHYHKALEAAERATEYRQDLGIRTWALVELVEAATRSAADQSATTAYSQLAEIADDSGTEWALGVKARSQALLVVGDEADRLYQESILRLGRVRMRSELARAHLLYGEWLRRERRRGRRERSCSKPTQCWRRWA